MKIAIDQGLGERYFTDDELAQWKKNGILPKHPLPLWAEDPAPEERAEWVEDDHPRDADGKFGSGDADGYHPAVSALDHAEGSPFARPQPKPEVPKLPVLKLERVVAKSLDAETVAELRKFDPTSALVAGFLGKQVTERAKELNAVGYDFSRQMNPINPSRTPAVVVSDPKKDFPSDSEVVASYNPEDGKVKLDDAVAAHLGRALAIDHFDSPAAIDAARVLAHEFSHAASLHDPAEPLETWEENFRPNRAIEEATTEIAAQHYMLDVARALGRVDDSLDVVSAVGKPMFRLKDGEVRLVRPTSYSAWVEQFGRLSAYAAGVGKGTRGESLHKIIVGQALKMKPLARDRRYEVLAEQIVDHLMPKALPEWAEDGDLRLARRIAHEDVRYEAKAFMDSALHRGDPGHPHASTANFDDRCRSYVRQAVRESRGSWYNPETGMVEKKVKEAKAEGAA